MAETLAAEAAEFVRSRRAELFGAHPAAADESDAVRAKSTPTDPVTVVDTDAERLLRSRLAQLRPGTRLWGRRVAVPRIRRRRPTMPLPGCWIPSTAP
ncbi:inositol monophosphatase family protein [Mycobacterium ulcerans str. Harvey]|uniref:Inositol monophosphatase family protein n=1 Tax=Mycobacterium ulcerans str. Harvey TaxID=1299332 RepID=A0ABN0QTV3_MYCUL|nr:inositol monophosphatase family protein [Mycobacterium ulcerans str. Harvey]